MAEVLVKTTEDIDDIMNPVTFVAPDSQLAPSITIEFCDRVRLLPFRSLATTASNSQLCY